MCSCLRSAVFLLSGLAVTTPTSGPAVAETPVVIRDQVRDPHASAVAEASARFAIPEHWIRAVMHAESAGDPRSVSHAGAVGLMQVMPFWRLEIGRPQDSLIDTQTNIRYGTAILAHYLEVAGDILRFRI